jgi:hypothetical protein
MGKNKKKQKAAKENKAKLSRSYEKFERTVERSLNLMSLQQGIQKVFNAGNQDKVDPSDLTRAAVVLSVAAMDAYFTDVFAERFIPFLKNKGPTDKICEILNKAGLNTKVALELLSKDRPYRRIRTLIEQYFDRHTTQRVETIDDLFLSYGIKNFSQNIQKLKGRKRLLRSIKIIVERRHKVVHEGDLNAHRRINPINYNEMKRRIIDVVAYVSGAEQILQTQI